jgi:hypothetical protein
MFVLSLLFFIVGISGLSVGCGKLYSGGPSGDASFYKARMIFFGILRNVAFYRV